MGSIESDVFVAVNVTSHWTVFGRYDEIDTDIHCTAVKPHSSATVMANVTVGINPKFEDHHVSIGSQLTLKPAVPHVENSGLCDECNMEEEDLDMWLGSQIACQS